MLLLRIVGCWGDETSKAVVLKISNKEEDANTGAVTFLIVGLNPRRPFDYMYRTAFEDMRLLVLGSLKSITAVRRTSPVFFVLSRFLLLTLDSFLDL